MKIKIEVKMTKLKFTEILVSRFASDHLDDHARYNLIFSLMMVANWSDDSEEYKEWTQNIMEILFPEDLELIVLE